MSDFWNARYGNEAYAYGEQPNAYFKSVIDRLPPGRILVPGAGEGRDAVYAATLGWDVVAFDLSSEGRRKAQQLAQRHQVTIDYRIMDAAAFVVADNTTVPDADADDASTMAGKRFDPDLPHPTYDLIALIFLHLPLPLRFAFHRGMVQQLKPGGILVMEAFSPGQLAYQSGGPKDPGLLYASSAMDKDFEGLQILENRELVVDLSEGSFHQGPASVMRLQGVKVCQSQPLHYTF